MQTILAVILTAFVDGNAIPVESVHYFKDNFLAILFGTGVLTFLFLKFFVKDNNSKVS